MNLKPFDLKAALAGAPVVTRNGRKVVQLTLFDTSLADASVVGVIDGEMLHRWFRNGKSLGKLGYCFDDDHLDLFMAPVKREAWVNLYRYPDGVVQTGCDTYKTKESARERSARSECIGQVRIEWEE